jgi:TRAP-type transport system periplasmic protein
MNRKSGYRICSVMVAMVALLFASSVLAQDKVITWKMAGAWGPGDAAYLPEAFAKELMEKSGGRIKVITYPGGQLYGVNDLFGALQKGLVQVADIATSWLYSSIPISRLVDLPFFLKDNSEWKAWLDNGMWEIWQRENEKVGLKVLATYGWNGMQGFSTYPIRTLDDAKGHKWRVSNPPMATAVKVLGGTPSSVPITEAYQALEKGVVDTAFAGVTWAYGFKWYEVGKYVIKMDLAVPGQAIFVNRKALDALPKDLQEIVIKVGQDNMKAGWKIIDEFTEKKWKAFKDEGCTIINIPDSERNKAIAKCKPIWDEEAKKLGAIGEEAFQLFYKTFPDRKP